MVQLKRPNYLLIEKTNIMFNFKRFSSLEIDILHINEGKKGKRKTSFDKNKITLIVKEFIDGQILKPSDVQDFDDEFCTYYVIVRMFQGEKFKIVFCICSDRPDAIGIITLFRL